jgi:hypothetical protein
LKIQSGKERRSRPERLQVFPLVVAAVVAKLKKKKKGKGGAGLPGGIISAADLSTG